MAVASEYHVTCSICDDGVRMCGGVVKKLIDQLFGVLRWIRLLCGGGSQCHSVRSRAKCL